VKVSPSLRSVMMFFMVLVYPFLYDLCTQAPKIFAFPSQTRASTPWDFRCRW
jgi:hypothetical protein